MHYSNKLTEYKNKIETLREIDELEVYRWLISLGAKLDDDPLSEEKRIDKNKVSRCQFDLFVDWEGGKFKAWSNATIASGYAYILLDIFNSLPLTTKITVEDFQQIKLDKLLTMNRRTGFYQMIEMIIEKIKEDQDLAEFAESFKEKDAKN
jgi:sulfur transfer protein SufE